MASKATLKRAHALVQKAQFEEAFLLLNSAEFVNSSEHVVYDLRAAILERLGRYKDSLKDAKKSIELQPSRWQAYARSARLFLALNKPESALVMIEHATKRIPSERSSNAPSMAVRRASPLEELRALRIKAFAQFSSLQTMVSSETRCHIGKLPVELLNSIMHYLAELSYYQSFIVAAVCKHWRLVALQDPRLWHTLILQHQTAKLKTAHIVIKRSAGYIKTMYIDISQLYNRREYEVFFRVMRWDVIRSLQITGGPSDVCQQSLRAISAISTVNLLTSLEDLKVDASPVQSGIPNIFHPMVCKVDNCMCTSTRSTLKSLVLRNFATSLPLLPQATLRHIRLENCLITDPPSELYNLLSHNTSIETLVLNVTMTSSTTLLNAPRITLSNLTQVELKSPHDFLSCFANLNMPQLKYLTLSSLKVPLDRMLAAMTPDLGRFKSMEKLAVENCFMESPARVLDIIRTMDSLHTLTLSRIGSGVNVIVTGLSDDCDASDNSVGENCSQQLPCPRLKHVNFSYSADLSTSPILSLVQRRLPSHKLPPQGGLTNGESSAGISAIHSLQRHCRISNMNLDGCPLIEVDCLPWLRQQVKTFTCLYMDKKKAAYRR